MMKKIAAVFLIISLMILFFPNYSAKANSTDNEVNISSPSVLLMDCNTGKVLYEKNCHDKRPCASITKVMTLCLIFEALDSGKITYDTIITASPVAASTGGSDIWLVEGEQMSVNDLIKSIVIVSANDASVAMAEALCGSEESFVREMNEKAESLGMKDTTFKNCNGLDEDGHVTSAFDVAVMSRELMKHEDIYKYTTVWIDYIRDGQTQLVNTNKLLKSYNGITGLKTGTTSKAGACISATAEREGLNLISVVLGAQNTADRFKDAAALLDFGFANYTSVIPQIPENIPQTVDVLKGMSMHADVSCNVDKAFLMKKGEDSGIISEVIINEEINAPIEKGEVVGKIVYMLGDEILGEFPFVSESNIPELNFKDVFSLLFELFLTF